MYEKFALASFSPEKHVDMRTCVHVHYMYMHALASFSPEKHVDMRTYVHVHYMYMHALATDACMYL